MPIDCEIEPRLLLSRSWKHAAGIDEAGRGPWAGPVIASAVIILSLQEVRDSVPELRDSKKLSSKQRAVCLKKIISTPGIFWAIGEASVEEIDQFNILEATKLAMARAIKSLPLEPDGFWVDGSPMRGFLSNAEYFTKGDDRLPSIAAASVLAKETRDSIMRDIDESFPQYGFANHKGYGTAAHADALKKWGPCPHHRQSFAPVRSACGS
jgi:ribonuclease HII